MPALILLPSIQRGDTTIYTFNFSDGEDPIDMRGKTVALTLKLSTAVEDEDADVHKQVTPLNTDTAAAAGTVLVKIESSETASLVQGTSYHFAVRVIQDGTPEDVETTYLYGTVRVDDV